MIGDNVSSHGSMHVLKCCEQNNIDFVLLPPNATHLVQPLTERRKDENHWSNTLREFLKGSRLSETQETRPKRGKKLKVAPGKGIKKKDLYPDSSTDNDKDVHLSIDESSENENKID